ncbi:RagB/SusD family nutrient uptake outer membrane protein [Sphingobacterium spiritivorum]|uniref:SusD family protein n=1 Tax=Sphingobacterium spiritivorum ATCC 33861 TaxID=525373 RepID=D7VR73_SPHSI|nr:RagB/SusD family nutrient uptake outer membrane protein [Sphingobacterium spiritivorum]EFK56274.1 SusD family protein [Sphingobacterium spiritivorum ATCC 33861]QQT35637.1 RagB/SusD family nutrient uptake outer membrane protein [Sphingobacterium spiritivorum]WQD32338.1 RagB/SusD family nutrient uptake outer membrane protein [Sphingobacterium spiritivorum]SUJ08377.1 SusD family [Sphingobacterium spiritivorum]
MKAIKNITYLLLATATLSGCSKDFLDEDTSGFQAPDNTYTTTNGFETGLTGLYAFARLEFQTWTNDFFTQGATPQESLQVGTDIVAIKTTGTDATLAPFSNYTLNPASSYVRNYWRFSYGLIGNSNLILSALDNPDIKWTDPVNDPKRVRATADFFRAYGYRYLVSLYGDVPWVDKVSETPRTDFTRTPKAEVLQHMITDLRYASENLPDNPNTVADGKLTKWAALHYLAEAYLWANKPDSAIIAANAVINSGYFKLNDQRFGVEKDNAGDYFHDMFIEKNQNRKSGNQETIWAMQLEYNSQGGGDLYTDWSKRAWVPFYSQQTGFVLADSLGGRGLGHIRPFDWWLNGYEAQDVRNSKYNIKRDWYHNDPKSPLFGTKLNITQEIKESGNVFATTTKFFYGKTAENPAFEGNMKDRVKVRLAETYLLLAEAYLQKSNPGLAADAINVVRARAKATPASAAQVNIDYLLDERARELLGEEMRRITLSRFGREVFLRRVKELNTQSKAAIKEGNELWPIPQEVIDANSDAVFPQNQGYN